MKFIGTVRELDKLGRVVIPMEMRRTLNINPGDKLEIFAAEDGFFIRKYDSKNNGLEGEK